MNSIHKSFEIDRNGDYWSPRTLRLKVMLIINHSKMSFKLFI